MPPALDPESEDIESAEQMLLKQQCRVVRAELSEIRYRAQI
jgi:hypothetical protein